MSKLSAQLVNEIMPENLPSVAFLHSRTHHSVNFEEACLTVNKSIEN